MPELPWRCTRNHREVPLRVDPGTPGKLKDATAKLYEKDPDPAELAAAGLTPEDFVAESFDIWPENEPPIALFSSLSTQWRIGMSGPTGLDYNVLFTRMERMGLSSEAYEAMFQDIRVIESEALSILNQRDKE